MADLARCQTILELSFGGIDRDVHVAHGPE
jgi:hypothetical protein